MIKSVPDDPAAPVDKVEVWLERVSIMAACTGSDTRARYEYEAGKGRMPGFVIGIDGGGSSTSACAFDLDSHVFVESHAGPSNIHSVGLEAACDAIIESSTAALEQAGCPQVEAIACCLSGAGRREDREQIEAQLKRRGVAEKIIVRNDAEAVLASAMVFGAGIAAIAGTGSFVWGRNESGEVERADGWGSLLGDHSGAFQISLNALRAACAFHDGSGPQTRLLDFALDHYAVTSTADLVPVLAGREIQRKEIAAFAPRVIIAAENMDPVAVEIVEAAATQLVRSVYAVRAKLFENDEAAKIVLGGRLALEQKYFQERFAALARTVSTRDQILCPKDPASLGAARIAMREIGLSPEEIAPLISSESIAVHEKADEGIRSANLKVFEECARLLTEQRNPKSDRIDELEVGEIVELMNEEDHVVALAVRDVLPSIVEAIEKISEAFAAGGRLFYIGAGTSGRLGCLDAAECPPTFGTAPEKVQALIAGGMATLLRSREGAEDDTEEAIRQLEDRSFDRCDVLVGLAASRRTPYVLAGLDYARSVGAQTVLITCTPAGGAMENVDVVIAPLVGPEVVMGSTRLKAATAQKMVLNMLTTVSMVRSGKVYKGMMVDLQLSCGKLSERAKRTVMMLTGIEYDECSDLLNKAGGNVKRAIVMAGAGCSAQDADKALKDSSGFVRAAIITATPGDK